MSFQFPLSALLSQVLVAFTNEFEHEVEQAGYPELSLALGSNVLRFLGREGLRISEIADLAGLTKQAISQQVSYLERHGQVEVMADPVDGRAKLVRLTPQGLATRDICRPLFATIEERWEQRHGNDTIQQLRDALEAVSSELDHKLPHYPV